MKAFICFVFLVITTQAIAQDDRLFDVKQIMRDTFDIIRSAPAPPVLAEVGTRMLAQPPQPQVQYVQQIAPQQQPQNMFTPRQIYLMKKIRSNQPLTFAELEEVQKIQEYLKSQQQNQQRGYPQYQQQPGPYPQPVYGAQGYPAQQQQLPQQQQQPSPMVSAINRIFATPTKNDLERLIRLPTEIFYKVAEEGGYIEPDQSESKFTPRAESIADAGSSTDAKKSENMFGSFNFDIQGNGNGKPGGNPFLTTTEKPAAEEAPTTTQAPETSAPTTEAPTTTTPSAPETTTVDGKQEVLKKLILDHEGHVKPYFYYSEDKPGDKLQKWLLVFPSADGGVVSKISVAEIMEMSNSLFKATNRTGVSMPMLMSSQEVEMKNELPSTTAAPSKIPLLSSTVEKKPKENNSDAPASSFVQEAEVKSQETEIKIEEQQFKKVAPNEIVLDGVTYKKVDAAVEAKPPRQHKKKAQHAAPKKLVTAAPEEIQPAPAPVTVLPTQSAAQAPLKSAPAAASRPSFTPEQQSIIYELQRRFLEQQQEQLHQQRELVQQPMIPVIPQQVPVVPTSPPLEYYVNRNAFPTPQSMVRQQAAPTSYFGKINVPENVVQIPAISTPPPQKPHIQVQNIAEAPALPMLKQYSLAELGEYYKAIQSTSTSTTTEAPAIVVAEVVDKVYGPHKQVKIQFNRPHKSSEVVTETKTRTSTVDSTADAAEKEKRRVEELRRQFALQRQQLAAKSVHHKIERTTILEHTTASPLIVSEQHCFNIRSFARQHGISDVVEFATDHCRYIENYYPDLRCSNVNDYMAVCKQYYVNRRMLFN